MPDDFACTKQPGSHRQIERQQRRVEHFAGHRYGVPGPVDGKTVEVERMADNLPGGPDEQRIIDMQRAGNEPKQQHQSGEAENEQIAAWPPDHRRRIGRINSLHTSVSHGRVRKSIAGFMTIAHFTHSVSTTVSSN